jgi:hypothetical protein
MGRFEARVPTDARSDVSAAARSTWAPLQVRAGGSGDGSGPLATGPPHAARRVVNTRVALACAPMANVGADRAIGTTIGRDREQASRHVKRARLRARKSARAQRSDATVATPATSQLSRGSRRAIRPRRPMRWLEVATTPDAIARALSDHGIAPRAPPPSATAPEQLTLPFGACQHRFFEYGRRRRPVHHRQCTGLDDGEQCDHRRVRPPGYLRGVQPGRVCVRPRSGELHAGHLDSLLPDDLRPLPRGFRMLCCCRRLRCRRRLSGPGALPLTASASG